MSAITAWETINCILCDSKRKKPFMDVHNRLDPTDGTSYKLVQCECGLVYLDPRPTIADIGAFYQHSGYDPHTAQSQSLIQRLYRFAQFFTMTWKFRLVQKNATGQTLLDIGGGQGEFVSFVKRQGWKVALQDSSTEALELARHSGVDATYQNLVDIPPAARFDVITMWHSLEHIHDISELFIFIDNHLAPGGTLVIAVPNRMAAEEPFYKEKWAPWDAPRHLYHFRLEDVNRLLFSKGFTPVHSQGMFLDTIYNILLSTPAKSLLNILFAGIVFLTSLLKIGFRGINSASSFVVISKSRNERKIGLNPPNVT